jgi:hypothetical protein
MNIGGEVFSYDCAAQPNELRELGRMETVGCNWPSTNPFLEIDVGIDVTQTAPAPIHEQTFDLSTTSPSQVQIVAGFIDSAGRNSIYSSSQTDPTGATSDQVITPGARGVVVVHSFDATTGQLDASLSNVVLPISSDSPSANPNAPAVITIASADISR